MGIKQLHNLMFVFILGKCSENSLRTVVILRLIQLTFSDLKLMNNTDSEVQNPQRKLDDKCLCLSYVFGSVLACAKSAHVFQKLSYTRNLVKMTMSEGYRVSGFIQLVIKEIKSTIIIHQASKTLVC